ncbi:MAG TPA: phosphomethylpyrimidine synthase ThiC, partial [Alphaproteobacteria bacterium]|nr:phosphomethylpyrimidine synthase ThiC [Alphaproteobacteria bacterium]
MPDDIRSQPQTVSTGPLPASRKIYVSGKHHPDLRVPMREIDLAPSAKEPPVRVYDTSGPYTDPAITIDIRKGLAPMRAAWITARGDVESYDGRAIRPEDDGLRRGEQRANTAIFTGAPRKPLRAKPGRAVTQLHYARKGIITPEMEYIAIRENLGREAMA